MGLWNAISGWFGAKPEFAPRSPAWARVRKRHLSLHPACAVCGAVGANDVHHKTPVHVDKSLELWSANLVTLCRVHHLWHGHLGSWLAFNRDIDDDIAIWRKKIANRAGGWRAS